MEASHSEAWRHLDVAIVQRYLLDEVFEAAICRRSGPDAGIYGGQQCSGGDDGWEAISDRAAAEEHAVVGAGGIGEEQRSDAAQEHVFLPEAGDGVGDESTGLMNWRSDIFSTRLGMDLTLLAEKMPAVQSAAMTLLVPAGSALDPVGADGDGDGAGGSGVARGGGAGQ